MYNMYVSSPVRVLFTNLGMFHTVNADNVDISNFFKSKANTTSSSMIVAQFIKKNVFCGWENLLHVANLRAMRDKGFANTPRMW